MPASFSPAPNSMASLSIEEGAGARQSPSTLDTATTTVPVVIPVEKEDLVGASSSLGEKDGEKDGKKKKNRCLSCKKKVGLTGFTCRCGGLFCSIHRYSDKHECGFDYKALGAEEISKSNPVVVAFSAPYTDTATSMSVALTIRPWGQRRSVKVTQWWWLKKSLKFNWIVPQQ